MEFSVPNLPALAQTTPTYSHQPRFVNSENGWFIYRPSSRANIDGQQVVEAIGGGRWHRRDQPLPRLIR
ncbi:MAG: hypothetical protein ACKO24_02605 [Leptolyngbyaceae cyanobacterium]